MGSDKTWIDVRKVHLPTTAPYDYSEGAFCIKLSPEWFGIVMGWIDYLKIRGTWENKSDEQWSQIRRWIEELGRTDCEPEPEPCPEPPECPECPEPEPEQPGGGGHHGAIYSGKLGIPIEVLEELLMGSIMGIRWNAGKLQVQYFPCCDWVDVEGMVGIVPSTGSTPPSEMSFLDWVSNQIPLPPIPAPPHENPAYVTLDAIRCAKATALVNRLKDALGVTLQATLIAGGTTSFTYTTVIAYLATVILTGGTAAIVGLAATIVGTLAGFQFAVLLDRMNDWHDDVMAWDDLICTLSGAVVPGEAIEPTDVKQLFYYFMLQKGIEENETGVDTAIVDILKVFPMHYFRDSIQAKVAETDCGCEQYLPYDPNAGNAAGFKIAFKEFGYGQGIHLGSGQWGTGGILDEAYAAIYAAGRTGQIAGVNLQSVAAGSDYGGGGNDDHYRSAFTAVFEANEVFTLTHIRADMSFPDGVPVVSGSTNAPLNYGVALFDETTQKWLGDGTWNWDAVGMANPLIFTLPSPIQLKKLAVHLGTRNDTVARRVLANMRFSGTVAGVAFTDLPMNVVLPPEP